MPTEVHESEHIKDWKQGHRTKEVHVYTHSLFWNITIHQAEQAVKSLLFLPCFLGHHKKHETHWLTFLAFSTVGIQILSVAVWELSGRDKAVHVYVWTLSIQMKALRGEQFPQRRDETFFFFSRWSCLFFPNKIVCLFVCFPTKAEK